MGENKEIMIINIDDILPNRFQPRIKFDEKAINELSESIKVHGVIQPIVVRRISDKFEIIAGERRYKASVLAGKATIPAIVTTLDDKESAEIALIENVQRQNLTAIEEAVSYKKILDMGYLSQVSLGEKLGKTQSTIANKLRLLNLNEDVQEALMENKISERHARSLLRLKNDLQIVMLNKIISERLTVRKADEEIEKLLSDSSNGSQKEKEMGETMNNDALREFNIPTEPIIEEVKKEEVKLPTIETLEFDMIDEPVSVPLVETDVNPSIDNGFNEVFNNVNPGFMNVEKIEETAQNIYKEESAPADINSLLDTTNNPVMDEPLSPMQAVQNNELQPHQVPGGGKFFSMFNTEEDKNPNYVSDIGSKEVNMNFGEPKIEETFNFNSIQFDQPVKNVEEIKPLEEVVSMENPIEPFNKVEDDLDKTMDFTHTFKPFSLNDEEKFTHESSFNEPVVMSEPISIPIQPITFDDMGEIEVKIPNQQQKLATADLKTVINTIRECAATIERFGFTIDTEEIDFEDTYQVIFKVDKN